MDASDFGLVNVRDGDTSTVPDISVPTPAAIDGRTDRRALPVAIPTRLRNAAVLASRITLKRRAPGNQDGPAPAVGERTIELKPLLPAGCGRFDLQCLECDFRVAHVELRGPPADAAG